MLSFRRPSSAAAVWASPERSVLTLESFGRTEDDGGRDLVVAARRTQNGDLREHLWRHARDESRHGRMFRERAAVLREALPATAESARELERSYDLGLARGHHDSDAHGFLTAGLYDELGEVEYVAMLHVAEQRAAELFAEQLALVEGRDEATADIFREILKDEKYHVAYTGRFLDRWRAEGRSAEVGGALKRARSSRFMGAWRRLGARSGMHFGHALLWVVHWTVFAPFALIGRGRELPGGWREPEGGAELEGQA